MALNADLSMRVVIDTRTAPWIASPEPGVERKLLDRVGDEIARATSVVRYVPGSAFASHEHALGEEFLVLAGTFADEFGEYPMGTYVRNPPGSRHRPFSTSGCELFVKLRQFRPEDRSRVVIDPRGVLKEFGVEVPETKQVRVWDSTAEIRYLVIPQRPTGSENLDEEQLAALVTRDSMVGAGVARQPGA